MTLFILGFGYSASHFARLHAGRFSAVAATCRSLASEERIRDAGFTPVRIDLDLAAFAAWLGSADVVLLSAAPDEAGDPFLPLVKAVLPDAAGKRFLYLSTVGVYGDHGGAWVDETTPPRPVSRRSRWRLEAEEAWQAYARASGATLDILRLSGIYGPGQSAIDTLKAGTARRLIKPGQVFNRIHVIDIAHAIAAVISRSGGGTWNVTDDEPAPPQDVVAHAAGLLGLPVPPDLPFETAELSPMARSFYGENKRVSNARIKRDLGWSLTYPTYREGLAELAKAP